MMSTKKADYKINESNFNESRIDLKTLIIPVLFIILSFINQNFIFLYPIIIIGLTLKRIDLGFSFIILTLGMEFVGFYDGRIGIFNPNSLQVLGLLFFCVISLFKLKKIRLKITMIIFSFLVIYSLFSLAFTNAGYASFTMFGKFLVMLLLLIIFGNYAMNLQKTLKLIIISGLISVFVFNFIYYFLLDNEILIFSARGLRLVGGASLPTAYALFMGICFISSLIIFRLLKQWRYLFLASFFFIYSILTYTRAAWVALFMVIVAYLFMGKKWMKILLSVLIILISINWASHYFLLDEVDMAPGKETAEVILQGRNVIWQAFYDKFIEQPVFGLGFEYTTTYSEELTGILSAHSDPLRILFDLGIIGFLIYLAFIINVFVYLYKCDFPNRYILLFFIFYFITSLTGNVFNYIQLIGFQVFALVGIALNKNENIGGDSN